MRKGKAYNFIRRPLLAGGDNSYGTGGSKMKRKMKRMNRLIAVILAAGALFCLFSFGVSAQAEDSAADTVLQASASESQSQNQEPSATADETSVKEEASAEETSVSATGESSGSSSEASAAESPAASSAAESSKQTSEKAESSVADDFFSQGDAGLLQPEILQRLYDNFIKDERWTFLAWGLLNTIIITLFAMAIGTVLGFLLAIIRVAHDKNGSLPVLNFIAKLYITIIRGTPVMIQLLIIYFVIFASVDIDKLIVAIIAFGINSAAYVSEVVRSGIMSIDDGQFEAGKSLGLSFSTTMINIILPQAFKNILPALGNEFISLLKETSISGYIGLMDLTKGGDIIRSLTYEAFIPLIAVALIYLLIVVLLSAGVSKLERRLKKNER